MDGEDPTEEEELENMKFKDTIWECEIKVK
jgi:hypothetical protein